MNSFFFTSALLYEGIGLIRKLNTPLKDNPAYQNGLRVVLRDPLVQDLEQMHLNPARNHAIFHFLPEKFEDAIRAGDHPSCVFLAARGTKNRAVHFSYADVVAAEMLVGVSSDCSEFWPKLRNAFESTATLASRFAQGAEDVIVSYLRDHGFIVG
jgi:hypothetical protein